MILSHTNSVELRYVISFKKLRQNRVRKFFPAWIKIFQNDFKIFFKKAVLSMIKIAEWGSGGRAGKGIEICYAYRFSHIHIFSHE